ncbi:MAG: permease [Candidatus Nanohaloarchaea archaeon]
MERYEYLTIVIIGFLAVISGVLTTTEPVLQYLYSTGLEAGHIAIYMTWITWWALVLGFAIAGGVEAWVPKGKISERLETDSLKSLGTAAFFGFVSSSCSYSAIATAKNLFKKGGSAGASLGAFMFASTNLVIEIGFVIYILLGWQFLVADFLGGFFLIAFMALGFRYFVPGKIIEEARKNVRSGKEKVVDPVCGMEVDPEEAEYSTEVKGEKFYFCSKSCHESFNPDSVKVGVKQNITSIEGWKKLADKQWKEWGMLYEDIIVGFILAGVIGAFVPQSIWTSLLGGQFLGLPLFILWSAIIGTVIGVATFVCSVGNVPFGAVLWTKGFPFGSILSYIYADLIVPPIIDAYREYYGKKFAAVLSIMILIAAVVIGTLMHFMFLYTGNLPDPSTAKIVDESIRLNYKTWLNIIFTAAFLALYYLHRKE